MKKFILMLQLFADEDPHTHQPIHPLNKTTSVGLSPTMKTLYDTTLLENSREEQIFTQFGKKQHMTNANTVEWRKFDTFKKALTPLQEGVIPDGQKITMSKMEASITQHGDYTAITDRLEYESFDDIIYNASEEMGATSGETYDTLTRNILVAGTSVAYGGGKNSRAALTSADKLTPALVNKANTWLKKNKAPKFDGYYVAIINPSVAEDLRESAEWKEFHKYNDVAPIFKGEIGTLHGIRFVESNEAKVWQVGEGESKVSVYATLFMGKDAFGVLDPAGEGMEMIIKDKSQIGGPLNQFSTVGYKFCHGAKILYQERLLRIETGSSYSDDEN